MAELTPSEKLQPCLLDRLSDDHPNSSQESRVQRVVSIQRYREAVLRDLRWLLNTNAHLEEEGLDDFPEVKKSVLNYGIRPLSGASIATLNPGDLERQLTEAIQVFEPRIIRKTFSVKIHTDRSSKDSKGNPTLMTFEIRGELWARPMPDQLFIKTEVDLETGEVGLKA